jgi:DNA polymerase III subunit delta
MPLLKPADAREQIAAGALEPLYLLVGGDETEKIGLVAAFAEAVEPDLRAFNVDRLYGAEINFNGFFDAVRTLPMMAPRRIIIVLQADRLFVPKRESEAAQKELEALEDFVRAPEPHATVVFVADALDGRRTISKLLKKHAVVVECGSLGNEAEAEQWVRQRVAEQGKIIEAAAARLMVERAGLDASRLRDEIERLCLYADGRQTLTVQDAREIAGEATSQDPWAMVRAIEQRQTGVALRELSLAISSADVPLNLLWLLLLGQLRSFVERNIPAERQGQAFDALLRTDLALKTSTGDPQVLLERLVVELCEWVRAPRGGAPSGWRS